jgi:hypothetical protein
VLLHEAWGEAEDFQTAAAHEIAHVMLGHLPADLVRDFARHEDEVAALVRDWGFIGQGSEPFEERG